MNWSDTSTYIYKSKVHIRNELSISWHSDKLHCSERGINFKLKGKNRWKVESRFGISWREQQLGAHMEKANTESCYFNGV
jgi:hypothetical protein